MTEIKNDVTATKTVDIKGIVKGNGSTVPLIDSDTIIDRVKGSIRASKLAESRSRLAMANMTALLVEMGELYISNKHVLKSLDALCVSHGLTPVKLTGEEDESKILLNIFLPLVRLVDGEWLTVFDKKGKPLKNKDGTDKRKWTPNRSFEKYASVIRFFLHNKISHSKVADILMGEDEIPLVNSDKTIPPTISEIVKADTAQQNPNGRQRTVWTKEAKAAAAELKPLHVIPLTDGLKAAFTLSEDNYVSCIMRLGPKGFEILGDAGMKDNGLLSIVKRRTDVMRHAYNKASVTTERDNASE